MGLHKVKREDLIGSEWPERVSPGVYCDMLGSNRLLCVVSENEQNELFDCLSSGKITIAPCVMGCSVYLAVKIGDTKTIGITLNPKECLKSDGSVMFFMNKAKVRRNQYAFNYAHVSIEGDKPIIKELRKVYFGTRFFKALDKVIECALKSKFSESLLEKQRLANSNTPPETVLLLKKPEMFEELSADHDS